MRTWTACREPGCDETTTNPVRDAWVHRHGLWYCTKHIERTGITQEALDVLNQINAQLGKAPYVPLSQRTRPAQRTEALW